LPEPGFRYDAGKVSILQGRCELESEAIESQGERQMEVRSTLACGVRSRKKMRIGVDHLATSERVDCEEIKDIAMYGGEGLRGECKHPRSQRRRACYMFLLGGSPTGNVTI
jgi:hypothetical protein